MTDIDRFQIRAFRFLGTWSYELTTFEQNAEDGKSIQFLYTDEAEGPNDSPGDGFYRLVDDLRAIFHPDVERTER
jgi:hypothetical protein